VLGTIDLTGDKVGDLAFAGSEGAKPDGTKPCYVGLIDGTNGKVAWHKEFLGHNKIRMLGAECHGMIVVQDNTRSIVAYEGKNGAQRWRLTLSDFIGSTGIWSAGTTQPVCLFATVDKQVAVVDVRSGKLLWRKETKTPWGRHGIKVGDSVALFPRQRIAAALMTGEEHELPLVGPDRRPISIMGSFAVAGEHFYYRPSKKTEIQVYDARSWKRVARIAAPAKLRAHLYPVGRNVMLVTSISKPAAHIALISGTRMAGSVQLPDDEVISQIRSREDVIVLLTVTAKGTKRTTVRVYDLELKQLWEAQLDDSGRSFQLVGYGPNFGGTSGGGRVIVSGKVMLIERGPDAEHRAVITTRRLHTGEVLGELRLPVRSRRKRHASLRLFRGGERRAFAQYSFGGDEIVAIDPDARKVVWTYGD
jgi:outer membrane protein assembly factor BamB